MQEAADTPAAPVDVAVSIVTYHSPPEEVEAALASLEGSALSLYVQLVDNASGAEYVAALRERVAGRAILDIAPRNGGFGYGHNRALLRSPPSRYYLVLNPDVRLHAGALEALVAFLDARPEAGLAAPKVLYEDGRLQPLNKRNPTVLDLVLRRLPPSPLECLPWVQRRLARYQMLDIGYDAPCRVEFVSGCCMLFRRSILDRLGGFDERFFLYFEDADITRRVDCIAEAWYCPDAVITHRWHRASKQSLRMFRVLVESALQYFTKWGVRWW